MDFARKTLGRFVVSVALALVGGETASAQDYPVKPIRLVVAQASGSSGDVFARLIGQKLQEALGQSVIVDNRPGANAIIGVQAVVKAAPDGYTILLGTTPNLAINAALYQKLPYDTVADLSPVALVAKAYFIALAPVNSPMQSMKEFIAAAKAKPNQLTYGSGSSGATISIEMFSAAARIKLLGVPYKSSSAALMDVIGGRVDFVYEAVPTAAIQMKTGTVKPLAITSPQRYPQFPDLPTIAEAGLPGFEYSSWVGLHGPSGIPSAIQKKLSGELRKILSSQDVTEKLRTLGFEPRYGTPGQLPSLLEADIASYRKIIAEAGIPRQ